MTYNGSLKAAITRKYGTQTKFAQALKVSNAIVSLVINGRYNLTQQEKRRWARALGAAIGEVFPEDICQ